MIAATWGWLYWGWHEEKQAVETLGTSASPLNLKPLFSSWLRGHLGSAGFVLDRVNNLQVSGRFRGEYGRVKDLSALTRLKYLERLSLTDVPNDFSPIGSLTNLKYLELQQIPIKNLSSIATLTHLETLELRQMPVSDLSALASLSNITYLAIGALPVTDLSPVASLPNLKTFWFVRLPVKDLSPLARLGKLEKLLFGFCDNATDISPLHELTNLKSISFGDESSVTDFSPLKGLKLTSLNINSMRDGIAPPSEELIEEWCREFPDCAIRVGTKIYNGVHLKATEQK